MARKSTRVIEMSKNFISLQNRGLSISEIADMYNLSKRTVYYELQAIADENGVSRKDLLENDYPETRQSPSRVVRNDIEEDFISFSKETLSYLDSNINKIEIFLKSTGGN